MKAGATVRQVEGTSSDGEGMPEKSWRGVAAAKFIVRQPGYAVQRQKAASAESLYELVGVDWYRAEKRLARIGDILELPKAEFSHPLVPSLLVVNVQLPSEGPKMFSTPPEDGPTLHAVFYFTLREETVHALENLSSAEPSLRLLADYFGRAESEPDIRKRFKALGIVNNPGATRMNRLVGPFNGKPVLITESGSIERGARAAGSTGQRKGAGASTRGVAGGNGPRSGEARRSLSSGDGVAGARFAADEFLELDISVRQWSFLARKGLKKLEPKFGVLNVSVAFLIEGREESELPERILGCGTLHALGSETAQAFRV